MSTSANIDALTDDLEEVVNRAKEVIEEAEDIENQLLAFLGRNRI